MRQAFFLRKVAVVTGGTRGLGLSVARELLSRGAAVAVCARDEREVAAAETELRAKGDIFARVCDVTKRDELERFMAGVAERFGGIDLLFNVAGTIVVGPYQDMTPDDVRAVMETNFFAPMNAMELALPYFRRRGRGGIVNIGSLGGIIGTPHLAAYAASKFALNGFSQATRAELRRENVHVTVVNPGLMRTGSPMNATFKGRTQAEYAWFAISDALPFLTISAQAAARKICDACRSGEPYVVLSLPAQLAALAHGLAPSLIVRAMTLANDLILPKPTFDRAHAARGHESTSAAAPSLLTALSDRASERNNEVPAQRSASDLPG